MTDDERMPEFLMGKGGVLIIIILCVIVLLYLLNVFTNNGVVRFIVCGLASWMPLGSIGAGLAMCGGIPV